MTEDTMLHVTCLGEGLQTEVLEFLTADVSISISENNKETVGGRSNENESCSAPRNN